MKETFISKKVRFILSLSAIALFALFLRLHFFEKLPREELGLSEGITIAAASAPVSKIIEGICPDQGPLKYFILHAVLYLGRSEFLLVLPSLFFDLASILFLFYLGALLFDARSGLLASVFMAVSVWHIHYAISARDYPLYYFLLIANSFFLCRSVQTLKTRDWILYAATGALAFYAFFPSLFFLAAHACWLFLFFRKQKKLISQYFISAASILIAIIPILKRLNSALQFRQNGVDSWGLQGWEILESFQDHFGGIHGFFPLGGLVFILSFLWVSFFQKKQSQALLLLILIVVPVSLCLFCVWMFRMSLAPRYFLFGYPFFLLMAAAGIASWSSRFVRFAGAFVFFIPLCVYGFFRAGLTDRYYVPVDYIQNSSLDFPSIASFVEKNPHAVDFTVILPPAAIHAIQYYLDEPNISPLVVMRNRSNGDDYYVYQNSKVILYGLDDMSALGRLSEVGRLLVIKFSRAIGDPDKSNKIRAWLQSRADRVEHYPDVDYYYIKGPAEPPDHRKRALTDNFKAPFPDACLVECLIYPFNRQDLRFDEDPEAMRTSCEQWTGVSACR